MATKNGMCSFCGHETWHCSHGGHGFSWKEFHEWEVEFGKSKEMTAEVRNLILQFIPEIQERHNPQWGCWCNKCSGNMCGCPCHKEVKHGR